MFKEAKLVLLAVKSKKAGVAPVIVCRHWWRQNLADQFWDLDNAITCPGCLGAHPPSNTNYPSKWRSTQCGNTNTFFHRLIKCNMMKIFTEDFTIF